MEENKLTYKDLRLAIKREIKKEFKFTNSFCAEANLSKFNFSKILNGQGMNILTLHKSLITLKKLPPEHNLLKGVSGLNVDILLTFYNNQNELKELFTALDKLNKED